jgi:hypothetical protein
MGIRQSQGKNKKSRRGASAIGVRREEAMKKATRETKRGAPPRPGPASRAQ